MDNTSESDGVGIAWTVWRMSDEGTELSAHSRWTRIFPKSHVELDGSESRILLFGYNEGPGPIHFLLTNHHEANFSVEEGKPFVIYPQIQGRVVAIAVGPYQSSFAKIAE
jgi:hypothetical protein